MEELVLVQEDADVLKAGKVSSVRQVCTIKIPVKKEFH